MVSAWFMADDRGQDPRLKHKYSPSKVVPINMLRDMGVDYWYFDPDFYNADSLFASIREQRGLNYHDLIELSPILTENYEDKIREFYDEHFHTDEEVRFVLAGSGYFDVRDLSDRWIRIECTRGDMISLPAGIFHRFTTDHKNYIKAMRLFTDDPVWTPHSRATMQQDKYHSAVLRYRNKYCTKAPITPPPDCIPT